MRFGTTASLLICIGAASLLVAVPARASKSQRVDLSVPRKVKVGKVLNVRVRVASPSEVSLEQLAKRHWRTLAVKGVHRGSAELSWRVKSPLPYLTLRATAKAGNHRAVSRRALVRIMRPRTVLQASEIISAPQPGKRGQLRYRSHLRVHKGAAVVSGIGPQTPDGFLGVVTSVSHDGEGTQLTTEPTTLMAAVPSGSIEVSNVQLGALSSEVTKNETGPRQARRIWRRVNKTVRCSNGTGITIKGSVSVSPVVSLKAHWGLFGGLSGRFEGGVRMNGELSASAQASVSCDVGPITLAQWDLGAIDVQVGPVPVVFVPVVRIIMSGNGMVSAQISTALTGEVSATGGMVYEHGHFHKIGGVTHNFNFTSPNATGSATLGASIGPTLGLDLYGVAGPELDLQAGISFNANTSQNPWWTLSAPIDLGAKLSIPDLGIESGELTIYHKNFPLAQASGPFGGGGSPPPSQIVFDGSPGTAAPPAMLGPYQMTAFGYDPQELGYVSGVEGPTGHLGFSNELNHEYANQDPEAWRTWSNGYEGDVYAEEAVGEAVSVTLPSGTKAFYLYVEPDEFATFEVTVHAQDGTSSGPISVEGEYGATYFGFYTTGSAAIESVTIECPGNEFAIGEFGISSG
jgi:hypothetical protein